ncbi:glutamate synthase [Amylibacter marinus]|uniref:Glutamate synthase n=1 Tax=Amylibacter marinus TaxID=1475483 RepID=A0ABQ5VXD0_9RHOB|nr:NAD(P)/FAD-dependent oxidoreductase [Amylibacter marinus]GLQ36098.1 glutamate synthase [Amylibacter marinus]
MKIAILGCGIGGLAAAIFAQRAGFNVSLFDQFDQPQPVGSGLVIQPIGQHVLDRIGVLDDAIARGAKGYHMLGHDARSKIKVLDVSYGPMGRDMFGLGIHRAALFDILLGALKSSGAEVINNHRVASSTLVEDARYLHFHNGAEIGPFDLVIDATGAGSPISPLRAKPLKYSAIWGTVDWPDSTCLNQNMLQQRYRRASKMIGILPIGLIPNDPTPKAALFYSMPRAGYGAWRDAPLRDWQSEARALWPALDPFISQITSHDQMTFAQYSHGTLRRPFATRLVHIGDAAHRASPQLGQGANMALVDADTLITCLQNHSPPHALAAYARARRWHIETYQALSWLFTPMYQSDSRLLPLLRDRILAPLSTRQPARGLLTRLVTGTLIAPTFGLRSR